MKPAVSLPVRRAWCLAVFIFTVLFFPACADPSVASGPFVVTALQYDRSALTDSVYTLGDFRVQWSSAKGQLIIRHQSDTAWIVWQSLPGKGFCAAAIGNGEFEEKAGSFSIHDDLTSVTETQVIDNIRRVQDTLLISGRLLSDRSCAFTLRGFPGQDRTLKLFLSVADPAFNRTWLTYASDADERFFGFGEQPSHLEHKGERVPVLVQEQGIGRGDAYSDNRFQNALLGRFLGLSAGDEHTSYKAVPFYLTSRSRSFFLENYEYSEFDLTRPDAVQVQVFGPELRANIIYARSPYAAIEAYTAYAGRMRPLPDWVVSGAIVGLQGGTDKLLRVWHLLEAAGAPVSAFWVQDWEGQRTSLFGKQLWWNWELDRDHYPGWEMLRDTLAGNGITLMGYINPFLVKVEGEKPAFRRNLFQEALDQGFLVPDENGKPYLLRNSSFRSAILDLSNPACADWVKSIIKQEMLAIGLKGWMADFGEALPFGVKLHSGESPSTFHNRYPEVWGMLNRDAVAEAGLSDSVIFFSRSAYTKSPGYTPLFWQGDQLTGWGEHDGLPSALTGLLSGGISGFTLNHSDIGGYTSLVFPFVNSIALKRSRELLWRWMEYAAFTPVYRTHEGLGPEINYQVYDDTATAKHFARNAKIYGAWGFYRKTLMEEAWKFGYPICRPMFLEFPTDTHTYKLTRQYMVGSELLVAPVQEPGKTVTTVYLPAGKWVNVWTGDIVHSAGEQIIVEGLSDRAAVFYREGSVIGEQFKQQLIKAGIL